MKKILICIVLIVCLVTIFLCFRNKNNHPAEQMRDDLSASLDAVINEKDSDEQYIYDAGMWNNLTDAGTGLNAVKKQVTYEIVELNDGKAKILFTAPDVMAIFQSAANNGAADENELMEALNNALQNDFPVKEFDVEIQLKNIENHWYLVPNDKLSNALSGGLMEAYTNEIQSWIDVQEENTK